MVLYGGVSLAVYIYGVVIEVQRLLRAGAELAAGGDVERMSAYARALAATGVSTVNVDIVSGTSAGGINGILLAKALARGGRVEEARDVWLDGGDIEQLLQPPSMGEPKALLRSKYLEDRLEEGLAKLDVKPDAGALWPPPILDLFVSSTHLRGGRRRFSDSLGTEIDTRQYRYVFQLKLRRRRLAPSGPRGYNHDDFHANPRLTKLARATSAFPVAFEPVLIEPEDELLEDGKEASGWFADGGILNNKPFSEAIATIFKRSSWRPVRRWLFSIDPDPVTEDEADPPGPEPAFDQIAVRSIASIPRYQSIARDLADLEAHNERVTAAEDVVRSLEAEMVDMPPDDGGQPPLGPGPAAAYETLRRQAWELEIADQLMSAVHGEGEEVDRAAVHRAFRRGAGEAITLVDVASADLAFRRRHVYYVLKLLSMAVGIEAGDLDLVPARDALWAEFERISNALDEAFAVPESEQDDLLAHRLRGGEIDLAPVIARRTTEDALLRFIGFADRADDRIADLLERIVVLLEVPGIRPEGTFSVPLGRAFADFARRDAMLLSAELYGGLRQRDRVRHAQISPVAAVNTEIKPGLRLAGATLGHFGGFLDRDWRRNDLMWGRLDGAEILMRAILEDDHGDASPGLVDRVQEEILREELPEVLDSPDPWKEALSEHVGAGPSLGGLDGGRLAGLGLRAAAVVRRMLVTAADAGGGGGLLDGARAFALRAVANGIGFLLALVSLPAKAFFAKGRPLFRAIVALAILPTLWGLATFALGVAGVVPFTSVVGPASAAIVVYPVFLACYWAFSWAVAKLDQ